MLEVVGKKDGLISGYLLGGIRTSTFIVCADEYRVVWYIWSRMENP